MRKLWEKVRGRLVDWLIGPDDTVPVTPQRMRLEYLVAFICTVLPIAIVSVGIDLAVHAVPFTAFKAVICLMLIACLALLRLRRYRFAVDVLFFGGVAAVGGFYLYLLFGGGNPSPFIPLIALILFAALALNGLFTDSSGSLVGLLLVTLAWDASAIALAAGQGREWMHARYGVIVLHITAFGIGRFLVTYYGRLARIAEARRLMNRRLEDLVADVRVSGIARLEAFGHDLRSPLSAVIGVQNLLASTELNQDQRRYLKLLAKANRLLMEIVESIMKPESVGPKAETPAVSLRNLIDSAIDPYLPTAAAKGVTLHRIIDGELPVPPLPHGELLRVLGNLIDNALKYTERGSIVVTAAVVDDKAGGERLEIAVTDTGAGIGEGRLAAVRTGNAGPDDSVAGSSGRGLNSARRLVEDAGGFLAIDSAPGRGTTVVLSFPRIGDA